MIAGTSIGGLLNVTFGNAAELILASFVLLSGETTVVKGQITGSIIGNVAEYVAAVYFARKDQMSLVMTITVGSTIQVGLVLAPVLVLVSIFIGRPMNLVFANPLELVAIAGVAFAVNAISQDGEVT